MFEYKTAKDALQSRIIITVSKLAEELNCTTERVKLFIEGGYLTKIKESDRPEFYIVGNPPPEAKAWLKNAIAPLPFVPVIPVDYVREILQAKKKEFRVLLFEHNVQVYIDPILGSLMTVASFFKLFNAIYPWQERIRFDRQFFLAVLMGIDAGDDVTFVRPKRFDETLEDEIARVAKLDEPMRSLRAIEIYEAFKDAEIVTRTMKSEASITEFQERVIRIMERTKAKLDKRYQAGSSSSESSSSSDSAISSATSSA